MHTFFAPVHLPVPNGAEPFAGTRMTKFDLKCTPLNQFQSWILFSLIPT